MPREESGEISYDAKGRVRWGKRAAGLLIERIDTKAVFLVLRSAEVLDPGLWGIPGGRVEPGETELDAAIQESSEELGTLPHFHVLSEKAMTSGEFTYTTFFATMPGEIASVWKPVLNW